jgi:hypothetical protein
LSSAGIRFGSRRRLARLEQPAQRGGRSAVGTTTSRPRLSSCISLNVESHTDLRRPMWDNLAAFRLSTD